MTKDRKPCPICGKPAVEDYTPFCSKRCADLDLKRWLGGEYRIPTDEVPEGGYVEPEDAQDD
jgi:endogenous inhibitor of DNA gyrase (YacG/DUF329 family)